MSPLAGVAAAYRRELSLTVSLLRVRVGVLLCLVGPFVLVAVLRTQSTLPTDTLFGRWVRDSGFAAPLLVLGVGGLWLVPAVTSIVAGDSFATEDRYGTWPSLLTRGRTRSELFVAKVLAALTWTLVAVSVLAVASVTAGLVLVGHQPLVGLSGQPLPAGRAFWLVLAAWSTVLPPAVGFTALGVMVSVLTRNGPAGVGLPVVASLLMTVLALADGPETVRLLLLSTPFGAWHGLFSAAPTVGPLLWALGTSGLWTVGCLAFAYLAFVRHDVVGG